MVDPLTKLDDFGDVSRLAFSEGVHYLIVVDVVDFARFNDRHGALAGDALLVEIAKRLRRLVPPDEHLARLSGGRFAIVCSVTTAALSELLNQVRVAARTAGPENEPIHVSLGVTRLRGTSREALAEACKAVDDAAHRSASRLNDGTSANRRAPVHAFLRGDEVNARPDGVTLDDVLTGAHACTDDLFAWMFPVNVAGDPVAPDAPVLSEAEILAIRNDAVAMRNVVASYDFVLGRMGLVRDHKQRLWLAHRVDPSLTRWAREKTAWDGRFARVVRCLSLLEPVPLAETRELRNWWGLLNFNASAIIVRMSSILDSEGRADANEVLTSWAEADQPDLPMWQSGASISQ